VADVGETDNGLVVPTVVEPSDPEKADGVVAVLPMKLIFARREEEVLTVELPQAAVVPSAPYNTEEAKAVVVTVLVAELLPVTAFEKQYSTMILDDPSHENGVVKVCVFNPVVGV
jgi:hypothetical protein